MNAKIRTSSRVAAILALFLMIPGWPGLPAVLHGSQAAQAPALDRALRAGNLEKARLLVSENWAAAEQLFVSYLERAVVAPGVVGSAPDAPTLAGRFAEVHFRIVEYDFARSVVSTLESADAARRQQLIAAVRDYFSTLEQLRASYLPWDPGPGEDAAAASQRRSATRRLIARQFTEIANRFRALSFPRGELLTLRSMINVAAPSQPNPIQTADALADRLGDELSLVARRPYTEASLAMAERLGLPKRQATMLEEMGRGLVGSTDSAKLQQAAKYLERARMLWRDIPAIESVNYWLFPSVAPRAATAILPDLWSVYLRLKRPAEAQPLVAEALDVSRPFGGPALIATISAFASRAAGLDWDVAQVVLQASQAFGARTELSTMRQLSGSSASFRPDIAEKALGLAVALPDSHERAVTLEWYSRNRLSGARTNATRPPSRTPAGVEAVAKTPEPFPAVYDQLLQLCVKSNEVALTADALASQAAFQVETGSPTIAVGTFNSAIQHAGRSGNLLKAAQVANRAVEQTKLNVSVRAEFAGQAIEAATKAGDALELAKGLRARSQMGVGASHQSFQDLQQALAAAERYTRESGNPSEELLCLGAMASERVIRGEYQAAIDVLERTAERQRTASRDSSATRPPGSEASIYQQMTRIYSTYLGEPALAFATAERARQLIDRDTTETGGAASPEAAAIAYAVLARIRQDLGQPAAALEAYANALTAFRKPVPSLPNKRLVLTNRARYLTELGDYEAALRDWDEVLTLIKTTARSYPGNETTQKGIWLGNVARVHALAGGREKALALATQAIAELTRDTSDTWVGKDVIDAMVEILLEADRFDEAISFGDNYFKKVLSRPIAQPGVEKVYLETVARARVKAGEIDKARSLLLAAVEIDRNHPTAEVGGLGGSLLALGTLEIEARNFPKAKEYLVAARAAANPYDLQQIWRIEQALARALARSGSGEGAETHYASALTALESVRERLRPEEFRLRYGGNPDDLYGEYAGLLASKALISELPTDAVRAFQAAERKRAQILRGLLATGWSRIPVDAVPDQVRRTIDMEARIGAKRALLREQFDRLPEKRDGLLVASLQRDLKQLMDDHARLLTSVAQSQYRYAAPTSLAASLAAPVQAALGPSRVLVEYLVADDRSYAFVMSRDSVKVVPLAVGRERLRQQVQHLLLPFRQLRAGELDLARLTYDTREAYTLYQAIFAPVRPSLGSTSEILIVPDDVLNFLPFDALLERMPQPAPPGQVLHAEFASQSFLLRRYAITYLTSSAQLLPSAGEEGPHRAPRRFFALANPAAGRVESTAAEDNPLKRQLRSAGFDSYFAPIPGAEAEVHRIAPFFARDLSTIVSGAGATEKAYESQAGQYGIVHFATHGVASDGQPFYSTLILAPDSKTGDDGFLQAYEVLRTPLRAELVVLSGCETALGSEDWGQGLVGLVAAFQQAGARSVLATLWSIDESAAELMGGFYGAMAQGSPTSAALREAKLKLLQRRVRIGKVDISLAHPFFWAPFILVGAPAP